MLEKNPRCCVEVDWYDGPIRDEKPCLWEVRYKCVICTGTVHRVEHNEEKKKALNCIMQHYGGNEHQFSEQELMRVSVFAVEIQEMTGKTYGC